MGLKRQIQLQELIKNEKKNKKKNDWSQSIPAYKMLKGMLKLLFNNKGNQNISISKP